MPKALSFAFSVPSDSMVYRSVNLVLSLNSAKGLPQRTRLSQFVYLLPSDHCRFLPSQKIFSADESFTLAT
ncbi:MAG: hypothetical protein QNJ47_23705 [Nostocaceae cyanobacterium]|nr:hypothetical protein [Nostocaceae cyanobacterium]